MTYIIIIIIIIIIILYITKKGTLANKLIYLFKVFFLILPLRDHALPIKCVGLLLLLLLLFSFYFLKVGKNSYTYKIDALIHN